MHRKPKSPQRMMVFVTLAALSVGSACADKPEWAGKGKPGKGGQEQGQSDSRQGVSIQISFNDDSRRAINDYYGSRFRAGKCPPGLAKKHNGCLPPGQARKWARGRAIPADLRVYELPQDLRRRLPPPPPEHRYVRVAADILLIAIGSGMVIDAIEDIGR